MLVAAAINPFRPAHPVRKAIASVAIMTLGIVVPSTPVRSSSRVLS